MRFALVILALAASVAACGKDSVHHLADAPRPPIDAPVTPPSDSAMATPAYDITGGAHHVAGSRYSADVQIGHAIGQQPVSKGTKTLEGNAAVKP